MTPPLWSDDQVEERDDGYLILKDGVDSDMEQPLLLHSSEVFLKNLYPGMSRELILSFVPVPLSEQENTTEAIVPTGNGSEEEVPEPMDLDSSNDDDDEEDDGSADLSVKKAAVGSTDTVATKSGKQESDQKPKYQKVYQSLKRSENLANRIQPLVSDLKSFKHRPNKKNRGRDRSSREKMKVRALEVQQQKLLQKNNSNIDSEGVQPDENMGKDDSTPNEDDENSDEDLPQIVRLVRGLNSIRALYIHLLQIFNHKRRNDKLLAIGKSKGKSKRGGFCWVLGSKVYDSTSAKALKGAYKDCCLILESLISVELAKTIYQDPLGGRSDFWSKSWISEVKARAAPSILGPLSIIFSFPNAPDREEIQKRCRMCDELLHIESTDEEAEQRHGQYNAAVHKLHSKISTLLKDRFPEARVSIYGSCLSNLSLGKGADVDLSLWLPKAEVIRTDFEKGRLEANQYERQMKSYVFQVFHKLKNCGQMFKDLQPVTRARVPVVKGTYNFAKNPYSEDGSLNFDICFLNDIAVANSGLLREYTLIDPRIRKLLMEVKHFAKDRDMNSAKDGFISSYAWMNLVVFYLQCLGAVPNLQDTALMKSVGFVPDPVRNIWHCVKNLDTCYLRWNEVKDVWSQPPHLADATVTELLYGFFEFYSRRFPSGVFAVSIKRGRIETPKFDSRKAALFYSIEDPFETYDSYCPHDLSSPAREIGCRDLLEYFKAAENHLRPILLGQSNSGRLWPTPMMSSEDTAEAEAPEKTVTENHPASTRIHIEENTTQNVDGSHQQTTAKKSGEGGGIGGRPRGGGSGRRKGGRDGRGGRGQSGRGDRRPNDREIKVQNQNPASKKTGVTEKQIQQGKKDMAGGKTSGEGDDSAAGARQVVPKGKRDSRRRPPKKSTASPAADA